MVDTILLDLHHSSNHSKALRRSSDQANDNPTFCDRSNSFLPHTHFNSALSFLITSQSLNKRATGLLTPLRHFI